MATKNFKCKPDSKLSLLLSFRPWEAQTIENHLRQQRKEICEFALCEYKDWAWCLQLLHSPLIFGHYVGVMVCLSPESVESAQADLLLLSLESTVSQIAPHCLLLQLCYPMSGSISVLALLPHLNSSSHAGCNGKDNMLLHISTVLCTTRCTHTYVGSRFISAILFITILQG